ncbi:MAG: hypothetical protein ACOC0C_07050 [Bacteroidota bacterium]
MRYLNYISVLLFFVSMGCQPGAKEPPPPQKKPGELLVADTIIYDVIVRNTNPEDKWTTETLKNLNLDLLLNELFQAIYNREVTAIDYFTEKRIRPNELKKMERDSIIIRSEIGKVQFTEIWFYQHDSLKLRKEVLSVVLGQELYDLDNNVRGYKPVFKIELNPSSP